MTCSVLKLWYHNAFDSTSKTGCHNDVDNIKKYLMDKQGFDEKSMLILMDDGKHHLPTRGNIENAFHRLVEYSSAGDCVVVHYSGHGGRVVDLSGDEADGYDSTLIPVDFANAGHIVDDDILEMLVKPMAKGVNCTIIMDCCHSGTVLDLPYQFFADEDTMYLNETWMDRIFTKAGTLDTSVVLCGAFLLWFVLGALVSSSAHSWR